MPFENTVAGKLLTKVGRGFGLVDPEKVEAPAINPAAAQLNTGQADAARLQQQQFIQALQAQAAGSGPSLAQGQLQQATDSGIRQAMALGQSMPGMGNQARLRSILGNQAALQQQAAGQSALLRNQEMMQGQQMLGGALSGMRGQDLNQAGMQQQGNMGMAQLQAQNRLAYDQMNNSAQMASDGRLMNVVGAGINAGGAAASMSAGGGAGGGGGGGGGFMTPNVEPPTMMSIGGPVPGRAMSPGNSLRNDTVPAMLSPGEIVIPRSVAQDEDAPDKAAAFVAAVKAQKQGKPDEETLKRILSRLDRVEQMAYGGRVC